LGIKEVGMKKLITIIAAFSGLVLFNSCAKEAPEPGLNPVEKTNLLQGTCRNYWFYDGSQQQSLGSPLASQIIIGFKNGTNQAKKLKVLSDHPKLHSVLNSGNFFGADHSNVSLQPGLTCAEIGDLLDELVQDNHIDFAAPYFTGGFGPGNSIEVILAPNTTQAELEEQMKKTKTEFVLNTTYGAQIIRISKQSPKGCLETANELFESGLFVSAYPNWVINQDLF
jgi:hypothetical protein